MTKLILHSLDVHVSPQVRGGESCPEFVYEPMFADIVLPAIKLSVFSLVIAVTAVQTGAVSNPFAGPQQFVIGFTTSRGKYQISGRCGDKPPHPFCEFF